MDGLLMYKDDDARIAAADREDAILAEMMAEDDSQLVLDFSKAA